MPVSTIYLKGHVLVSDILVALEPMVSEEALLKLDKELEGRRDDLIMIDECQVSPEEALDAVDDAGMLPEPEGLGYVLSQGDVQGLAEAIRCGDREQAELLLDRVFSECGASDAIREWIDRGRYSKKARDAVRRPVEPARLVA